ncbi:MAG: Hsp33 family molecular chaperone HslO [Alphaproteobacteria bacterium]|nr:Hsp33 family molecular chaperone HslO [Alphaproteobacteria bacterium]
MENQQSNDTQTQDLVLPFQIEASPMRGRLVRLEGAIDTLLRRHDYPVPVSHLLAQATAMAAALGTALKFDGVFTIQTNTNGPVRMMVVDVTSDGAVRACAQFDDAAVSEVKGGSLLGQGQLIFTVDQTLSDERYQGIVQVDGDDLTEAFKLYFKQSEQIPTGLIASARQDEAGVWHAGCLMLQRMPSEGGNEGVPQHDTSVEDPWLRAMALMQTCSVDELTNPALPADQLLFRLFHEEGVRVYDPKPLRQACRCSSDKIAGILSGLPQDQIKSMIKEDGRIAVTCQFCNQVYHFDAALKPSD